MSTSSTAHTWKFFRLGGLDQVALESADDLLNLKTLDPKLWVALSCPVHGLEIDEQTLAMIDSDKDGRIRVPELLAAIDWAAPRLKDASTLLSESDTLELAAINDATPEGKALLASAKRILDGNGKQNAASVSLADACNSEKVLSTARFNGDGILVPGCTDNVFLNGVIADIVSCIGSDKDKGGASGLGIEKLRIFFEQLGAHLAWLDKGAQAEISIFGEKTAAAAAAVQAVNTKVDDFFARCMLASYDARSTDALNRAEADYAAIAGLELKGSAPEIAAFPLARATAACVLSLNSGLNPAWVSAVETLRRDAVVPAFGPEHETLSEAEWCDLLSRLAPYLAWASSPAGVPVSRLGVARLREIAASNAKAELSALIDKDLAAAPDFEALASVERLLRYCRDLRTLLRNFVNFFDFYSRDRYAVFQAGTLFLDSRSCELCIRVDNPGAHAALAMMSKAYIAYVDCKRAGCAPMTIAACFTQGDSDYLFVGRNGVFYDRKGRDWDATISKVVDCPISIGEAFWSPYKRVIRFVEDQAAKRAAEEDAAADTRLKEAAGTVAASASSGKPPREKTKFDVGTVAALGVAVGAITGAMGLIMQAFFNLGIWMPLGVVGMILLISGPSMIIAWLKLRQRNLGPILEANGWAINGRVMINIPFGSALTDKAVLPANARRSLTDPYADESAKQARQWIYGVLAVCVVLALAVAWFLGTWPFAK
jgi:hypothetical protein